MSQSKVFSPVQAAVGAFLGGPLASTIFISQNFSALNEPEKKSTTLIAGTIIIIALIAVSLNLPENFPGLIFTIATIITTRLIVEKKQFTKETIEESEQLTFHSNWLVFGIGMLSLLLTFAVAFLLIMAIEV